MQNVSAERFTLRLGAFMNSIRALDRKGGRFPSFSFAAWKPHVYGSAAHNPRKTLLGTYGQRTDNP